MSRKPNQMHQNSHRLPLEVFGRGDGLGQRLGLFDVELARGCGPGKDGGEGLPEHGHVGGLQRDKTERGTKKREEAERKADEPQHSRDNDFHLVVQAWIALLPPSPLFCPPPAPFLSCKTHVYGTLMGTFIHLLAPQKHS